MKAHSFSKRERLVSRKLIDTLFGASPSASKSLPGKARASLSMSAYPLRGVYMLRQRQPQQAPVQILVSVPKRYFKHAVDRNRVKRQVREAFRLNKDILWKSLPADSQLLLSFVWLSDQHFPSQKVTDRVVKLMQRIAEKLKIEN